MIAFYKDYTHKDVLFKSTLYSKRAAIDMNYIISIEGIDRYENSEAGLDEDIFGIRFNFINKEYAVWWYIDWDERESVFKKVVADWRISQDQDQE